MDAVLAPGVASARLLFPRNLYFPARAPFFFKDLPLNRGSFLRAFMHERMLRLCDPWGWGLTGERRSQASSEASRFECGQVCIHAFMHGSWQAFKSAGRHSCRRDCLHGGWAASFLARGTSKCGHAQRFPGSSYMNAFLPSRLLGYTGRAEFSRPRFFNPKGLNQSFSLVRSASDSFMPEWRQARLPALIAPTGPCMHT